MFAGAIPAPREVVGQPGEEVDRGRNVLATAGPDEVLRLARPAGRELAARLGARASVGGPALEAGAKVLAPPAETALLQQQRDARGFHRRAPLRPGEDHPGVGRVERKRGEPATAIGDSPFPVERAESLQPSPRRDERGLRRRIEPRQRRRVTSPPLRQREHQRREVGGQHLGRVERQTSGMCGLFPQAVGHARPLSRRAPGALGRGGLARPRGNEVGGAGRLVVFGPPGETAVDHDRHAVECQRGFRDTRRQHHPAPALRIAADRGALSGRFDLAMQRQDYRVAQSLGQPLAGPLDLSHARQEGEHVSLRFSPGRNDRLGHGFLYPLMRIGAQPLDFERKRLAGTLDHGCIPAQDPGEAGAVDRCRHDDHAQVLAQDDLALERKREAKVPVEVTFVRLVEQHRRHAGKLGIVEQAVDEDRLGYDEDPRLRRLPAVHAGRIADRLAGFLAQQFGHSLGCGAGGDAPWRSDDHLPPAPRLIQQRGRDRGCLARARRRDEHRPGRTAQGCEQVRQDRVDR